MIYRTLNPATEELIQEYPTHSGAEAEKRGEEAHRVHQAWRKVPIQERAAKVHQLAVLLHEKQDLYASLITQEMGKPITQAAYEIDKCARGCEFYAENAERFLKAEVVPSNAGKSYIRYDALGVILGIMPWNFPFWQVFRFAVPTLMAGNAVLIKPAPNVPASGLAIEKIFLEAGFPKGIVCPLFLSNEDTARLIESPWVQGVSLTGSDRAGSAVSAVAGKSLKKTVLELGGSDPLIVFEDADLEKAVSTAIRSRMLNTGQSCIAAKRIFVSKKVFSKFQKGFLEGVQSMKLGDPTLKETEIGPLAREDLLHNLMKQVDLSIAQGAKVLLGGSRSGGRGYFYEPTILTDMHAGMTAYDQELFGPVASLMPFDHEEEAIQLANQTCYGLGASLWTRDISRAESLVGEIEAGSVFINDMVKSDPRLPFGGVKRSGYGRELAAYGIHEFVNVKTVWIGS